MKTSTVVIGIVVFFAIALFFVFSPQLGNTGVTSSASAVESHHPAAVSSVFEGAITNKKVTPGKITGLGAYDRNCVAIGNGLTDCHAGINTNEYGVLDFNYQHNMDKDPCIVPGDNVVVEILDAEGHARVTRG